MHKLTKKKFNQFLARQAEINHIDVGDVSSKFNVDPSVEQKLEERVQQESDFLKRINVVLVDQMKGEKVGVGVSSTIAGRTDTNADEERKTRDIHGTDKRGYECVQTNYDTHLHYNILDNWRHKPEFQTIYTSTVNKRIALDRIMIGWNGTHAAKTTDRTANPLLQDVNKGWLQDLRDGKPAAVMSGKKVGKGGDYENLDAAVFDANEELIEEWNRDTPNLVVICGRNLLADKYFSLLNDNDKPTEKNAVEVIMANKTVGNLPACRVPYFPANAFMVTTLDNLSIYVQRETTRRAIIDNPKKDRVEDFRSVNEDYVIEDYDLACLVEGILTPDGAGGWK